MTELVVSAVVVAAAIVMGLQRLGWLPQGPTATASARRADEAEKELSAVLDELVALRATRSLEPILAQLAMSAEIQSQILDRLVSFNGALKATNAGLEETREGLVAATEAIKFLAGAVHSDYIAPAKPRARRKTA